MCFDCFSRFDIIEADEEFNNFVIQRKLEEEEWMYVVQDVEQYVRYNQEAVIALVDVTYVDVV